MRATKQKTNDELTGMWVNIDHDREISYWCAKLKCEPEDLIHAVLKIGRSAKMVDDFLFLNRKKKVTNGE